MTQTDSVTAGGEDVDSVAYLMSHVSGGTVAVGGGEADEEAQDKGENRGVQMRERSEERDMRGRSSGGGEDVEDTEPTSSECERGVG